MVGNFTVSLLEILAYLVPGGITLAAILYLRFPELADRVFGGVGSQIAFIACSYVIGHLLTFLSSPFVKLRLYIKRLLRGKPREDRISFYTDFQQKLHILFSSNITRYDEYQFALRLVIENQPQTGLTVDRLYAMTLFSRNISLSFLLTSCLYLTQSVIAAAAFAAVGILFFLRYAQLEAITANTVFRAAYIHLCSKREPEKALMKNA